LWDEVVENVVVAVVVDVAVVAVVVDVDVVDVVDVDVVVDVVAAVDTVVAIAVAVVVDDGEEQEGEFPSLERNVFLDVNTASLASIGLGDVDGTVVGREVVPCP